MDAKVGIVGTGFVGSTIAYSLMLDGIISSLVLIDKNKQKAEGHALDLLHGMQFTKAVDVIGGDTFDLLVGADIVILSAGLAQKANQTRMDLVGKNVAIFKEIIPEIVKYNKNCIFLVVTNPLDVMTYVTYKLSGFSSNKVFGTGTVLDTSRLRYLISKEFKISPKDITAYILGEHGDSQMVWWSHANIAGVPINELENCSEDLLKSLYKRVKDAVYKVIEKKGATYFAISTVVTKIVGAIVCNQSRVFTVSSFLKDYDETCLSVPSVINENGLSKRLDIDFTAKEKELFLKSVESVSEGISLAKKMGI